MTKFLQIAFVAAGLLTAACTKSADPTPVPAPAATASFTMNTQIAEVGEPVQLTSTSQNAVRYEWRSSDAPNSVYTAANPVFVASTTGTFTITLTAFNSENKSTTSTQNVKIGKRYLREIRVTGINFLNASGGAWDLDGSGPDIYVTLKPASVATATRTTTFNNVQQASLPLIWTVTSGSNIELTKESWTFWLFDEDAVGADNMTGWNVAMNVQPPPNRDALGNGYYTLNTGAFTMLLYYETR